MSPLKINYFHPLENSSVVRHFLPTSLRNATLLNEILKLSSTHRSPLNFFRVCTFKGSCILSKCKLSLTFPTTKCSSSSVQNCERFDLSRNIHRKRKKKKRRRNKIPFNPLSIIHAFSRKIRTRILRYAIAKQDLLGTVIGSAGIRGSVSCREIRRWFD